MFNWLGPMVEAGLASNLESLSGTTGSSTCIVKSTIPFEFAHFVHQTGKLAGRLLHAPCKLEDYMAEHMSDNACMSQLMTYCEGSAALH